MELAIKDYTKAIEIEPTWDVYYWVRGNAYKYLEQYDKALADYRKTKKLNYYDIDIDNDIKECEEALRGVVTQ